MSTLRQIRKLPNMTDLDARQIKRAENAADICISAFELRGFDRIETPLVEETELFLRKSGGELSTKLYDFEEPGGFRTSLRPEFTSAVIRYAIENGYAGKKTCRYQYCGPVFRYATPEQQYGNKTRQFNQLGAELIGPPAARADGEIISMALEGLSALGIAPVTIAIGHVGLLRQLLKKFELSERSVQFLLANAGLISNGELDNVRENARRLGFIGNDNRDNAGIPGTLEQIEKVIDRSLAPLGANAGSRTRQEVIARLARKQTYSDDPERFESALSMLGALMSISGGAESALKDGRAVAKDYRLDENCFDLLGDVIEATIDLGVKDSSICIRYGLARGVAYYTGMVFDILPSPDASDSLGGGGRYDGLTRALGLDADVPALGFAYSFDQVLEMASLTEDAEATQAPVLVKPAADDAWRAAAQAAEELRMSGTPAVLDDGASTGGDAFQSVITVDSSGNRINDEQGEGQ